MNTKEKYIQIFESFFCRFLVGVLGFGMLINVMMPDRTESITENRTLQMFPKLTVDSFLDGTFTKDVDEWFSDQFIGRDTFIYVRYLMQKFTGQKEVNGVYLTSKGLIEKIESEDEKEIARITRAINTLYENTKLNTYFMLAPNSATVNASKLPWPAQTIDQEKQIENIYASLNSGITTIDVTNALKKHNKEYLYYKSDHHWTSLAAFYALQEASSTLGLGEIDKSKYTVYPVTASFKGSLAEKVGATGYKDEIDIYVPKDETEYLFFNEGLGSKSCSVFDSASLERNDKYSVFMGGNTSICRLEMNNTSKKHLLVIKDSYANCLIPMLIPYYRTITVVDARYYYEDITRVINGDSITDILYLYNGNTFVQDKSLADMIENSLE
ncbi:MAG: DHHW family protein [Bacillota bacterium]|nr:DHHW family protein [Bacillota bacterium]